MPPAGTFGSATTQPIRRIVDRVTLRNTGRSTAAAELGELDRGECLRLLGKSTVGRVVFTEGALPAAHPVTCLLDDEEVIFRTGVGSTLAAAAARHHIVGFQADEIDPYTCTGWSVLGVGEAYEVVTPTRLAELAARQPVPWIPDRTEHTIAIPLQRLTGRRLHLTGTEALPRE